MTARIPFYHRKAMLLLAGVACALLSWGTDPDAAFFDRHRRLLNVEWTHPFSYESIRSRHAPLGPYIGNGDVGITAYTTANSQTLRISKVDFVTDGWSDWAGSGAAALPVGEASISVEGEETSDEIQRFLYTMDQTTATLSMHTATLPAVEMQTWLCPQANILVTEVYNRSETLANISVVLRPLQHPACSTRTAVDGNVAQVARRTKSDGNTKWVAQAGISTRIIGGKKLTCKDESTTQCTRQEFSLKAGTKAFVVTCISGGGKEDNARWEEAKKALAILTDRKIENLRREHQAWWEEMWRRSYIDTGDSLLNQQYLTSIYLMASAYSPKSPACGGMYGVWNMEDDMMYHGDIHLNYNSQAGFYSTFSANRPELSLPFFGFLEKMMPEGRRRAQEEMGIMHPSQHGKRCRGMLFPVSALGIGEFYGEYWQQTMDAPFNIPLWSWYYEYTGDEDFLRQRAYPFIRECGDFYEDYLQKEALGDSYRYNIITGGHENSWDLNPPSDLAFVELTFRLLLRYSERLGIDGERRALWRDIVEHLPPYRIIMPTRHPNEGKLVFAKNEAGWDSPAHVIQMHCAYPCETLHLKSDSTLLEIGRNTVYYYGISQKGLTETMNELGLSAFVMGARLGLPADTLLDRLRILARRHGKNLLITDGHHCLEKTAIVETLNSMMLQSIDGTLHLFPCWTPTAASFVRLRTKGAFVVSAAYDGHTVTSASIKSERGNVCSIANPWSGCTVSIQEDGRDIKTERNADTLVFPTKPGSSYRLIPHS